MVVTVVNGPVRAIVKPRGIRCCIVKLSLSEGLFGTDYYGTSVPCRCYCCNVVATSGYNCNFSWRLNAAVVDSTEQAWRPVHGNNNATDSNKLQTKRLEQQPRLLHHSKRNGPNGDADVATA